MKKSICLFLMSLFFIACEGPEGAPGRDGLDGYVDQEILIFDVYEKDWKLEYAGPGNTNPYYVYIAREPLLTEYIYEYGNIQGYIFLNPDTPNEVQTTLPYVLPAEESDGYGWLEVVNFDFTAGSVGFYLTYSDFNIHPDYKPGYMQFRVVLTW